MIKNNKGFAITTMLYGILAMILILLLLILRIMSSTYNINSNFVSTIEKNMNDCVEEELYLEDCYINGSDCDATSYYSCLGIREEETVKDPTAKKIADELKKLVVTSGSGLYEDPYVNDRYIYRGLDDTEEIRNFIYYSGYKWRIVAIEPNGGLKLVLYESPSGIPSLIWNTVADVDQDLNTITWSTTTLHSFLSTSFFRNNITDVSGMVTKNQSWYIGKITIPGGVLSIEDAIKMEQKSSFKDNTYGVSAVGVVSVVDYAKASTNDYCFQNILGDDNGTCYNWMSSKNRAFWTINGAVDTDKGMLVDADGKMSPYGPATTFDVYPVIYLKAGLELSSSNPGNGTSASPYQLN